MEQLQPASEFVASIDAAAAGAGQASDVQAKMQEQLYRRACAKVVSFFGQSREVLAQRRGRNGGNDLVCTVPRAHVQAHLPEFLAHLQSKDYDVQLTQEAVVITAK